MVNQLYLLKELVFPTKQFDALDIVERFVDVQKALSSKPSLFLSQSLNERAPIEIDKHCEAHYDHNY